MVRLMLIVGLGCDSPIPAPSEPTAPSQGYKTEAEKAMPFFDPPEEVQGTVRRDASGSATTNAPGQPLVEILDSEWDRLIAEVASGRQTCIQVARAVVTGGHLPKLQSVENLTELLLDGGRIDDHGLAVIASCCPNLEQLRLRLSPISDAGVGVLVKLQRLRVLNLPHSELSADGLRYLQDLPNLELLRLGGQRIDARAVAELVRLPELQSLHLINPALTDPSLISLAQAPKLTSLYLDDCPLSPEAWNELKKARPDLHIHLDQPHPDR